MKKLFIRKSFAVPLVVLFLTFLYPQTGRADCPFDWWCPAEPPNPEVVNNPFDPWGYSPGFDLVLCLDKDGCGLSSTLPAPHVTINSPNGCKPSVDVTLSGNAICAAKTDGVLDQSSVAACDVSITLKGVSCTLDGAGLATYSRLQKAGELPSAIFDPGSSISIGAPRTGWPCATPGPCIFPIGTQLCNSFNGCVAKIYPATGDGISFDSLAAGQLLKGDQRNNFLSSRACKGAANGGPDSITCTEKGKILTGGGEASVAVQCPQGEFAGNRTDISSKSGNNGFDLFGSAVCPLNGIVGSTVKLNGVAVSSQGCQPQGQDRIRCFFDEGTVYTASGCAPPPPTKTIDLVATGSINVSQGGEIVTVPFFTSPGQEVTCK